jgi:hypothetical protein
MQAWLKPPKWHGNVSGRNTSSKEFLEIVLGISVERKVISYRLPKHKKAFVEIPWKELSGVDFDVTVRSLEPFQIERIDGEEEEEEGNELSEGDRQGEIPEDKTPSRYSTQQPRNRRRKGLDLRFYAQAILEYHGHSRRKEFKSLPINQFHLFSPYFDVNNNEPVRQRPDNQEVLHLSLRENEKREKVSETLEHTEAEQSKRKHWEEQLKNLDSMYPYYAQPSKFQHYRLGFDSLLLDQRDLLTFRNILLHYSSEEDERGMGFLIEHGIPGWARLRLYRFPPKLRASVQFVLLYVVPVVVFFQGMYGLFRDWPLIWETLAAIFSPIARLLFQIAPFLRTMWSAFYDLICFFTPLKALLLPIYLQIRQAIVMVLHFIRDSPLLEFIISKMLSLSSTLYSLSIHLTQEFGQKVIAPIMMLITPIWMFGVAIVTTIYQFGCFLWHAIHHFGLLVGQLFGPVVTMLYRTVALLFQFLFAFFQHAGQFVWPIFRALGRPLVALFSCCSRHRQSIVTATSTAQTAAQNTAAISTRLHKLSDIANWFTKVGKGFWDGLRHYILIFYQQTDTRLHSAVSHFFQLIIPKSSNRGLPSSSSSSPSSSSPSSLSPSSSSPHSLSTKSLPNLLVLRKQSFMPAFSQSTSPHPLLSPSDSAQQELLSSSSSSSSSSSDLSLSSSSSLSSSLSPSPLSSSSGCSSPLSSSSSLSLSPNASTLVEETEKLLRRGTELQRPPPAAKSCPNLPIREPSKLSRIFHLLLSYRWFIPIFILLLALCFTWIFF